MGLSLPFEWLVFVLFVQWETNMKTSILLYGYLVMDLWALTFPFIQFGLSCGPKVKLFAEGPTATNVGVLKKTKLMKENIKSTRILEWGTYTMSATTHSLN